MVAVAQWSSLGKLCKFMRKCIPESLMFMAYQMALLILLQTWLHLFRKLWEMCQIVIKKTQCSISSSKHGLRQYCKRSVVESKINLPTLYTLPSKNTFLSNNESQLNIDFFLFVTWEELHIRNRKKPIVTADMNIIAHQLFILPACKHWKWWIKWGTGTAKL